MMLYKIEKINEFGESNNFYPYITLINIDKSDNSKINHAIATDHYFLDKID